MLPNGAPRVSKKLGNNVTQVDHKDTLSIIKDRRRPDQTEWSHNKWTGHN